MTAPIPGAHSPVSALKKSSIVKPVVGAFAVDSSFMDSQTIKVYVRLKPPADDDQEHADKKKKPKGDRRAWYIQKTGALDTIVQKGTARKVDGKTVFHFDQVFDEDAKTPLLYKSFARSMVQTVLNGKHATIFAYGNTGTGKTFTMQGDGKAQSGQAGIIQLVVSDLFRFSRMGAQSSRDFIIKVSYVEVYNERIRDLLSEDAGDTASQGTPQGTAALASSNAPDIQIRTSSTGEVTMNCVTKEVHTVEDVLELLIYGNSQRVVAKTDMNNHSSRSHAIFRLTVQSQERDLGPGAEVLRLADFNLVDLAGSENAKVSNVSGKRQKEGAKINQSLLSLSNVINALSLPEKKRPKHINYRDSKLTRILQPHLQGNAEMAIICCASAMKAFVEETKSTLRFGSRAKLVTVTPKVNELNDDSALIKKLQNELDMARKQLEDYKRQGVPEDERIKTPKQISVKTGAMQNPASSGFTDDEDDQSYGYEDMDAGPGHREFHYVSNQEMPPPQQGPEDAEKEKAPGMGGRTYVMPKTLELPEELQRQYVMPANQEIPLDLGKDYGDDDDADRQRNYVMPQDPDSPHNMDQLLKGRVGEPESDESSSEESVSNLHNSLAFQLDAVADPKQAEKAVNRYMKGRSNTDSSSEDLGLDESVSALERLDSKYSTRSDPYKIQDKASGSRHDLTGPTEDETMEMDGPERSYAGLSQKFGSAMSKPATLRGGSTAGGHSKLGSLGTVDNFTGRRGNQVSWDTMDLDTMQPDQAGRPLKAIQSLYHRDAPLPEEITIMRVAVVDEQTDRLCLTDRLNEAEAKASFMQTRLEMADDLVEGIFKDLERARLCIHDLVYRNAQLSAKLKEKKRRDIKEEYQEQEVVVEQYWLLKGSMYVGLFFFVTGGYEYFMATVFLVWLILELNLGASP